jgi:hypothetical protein
LEREALFLRSKNAPKIKKVPLKLYQIRNFSEIGIAATARRFIDKLIGESVQIFDTLVPINDNTFAVTNVDKKKAGLVA